MIKLFPPSTTSDEAPVEPRLAVAAEDRPTPADRPWLYTNMIASVDGGTAVDGLSGQLGGPADKAMFGALRSMADVILVGASTARQERYRAPSMRDEVVAVRSAKGQSAHPRLAIVTRSLDLDLKLPLFDEPANRPYVLTAASAPADRRAALAGLTEEIIEAGDDGVDLTVAMGELHKRGVNTILSEGGPSINGQLVAADLVDEWNLALSPRLLGGDSRRAAIGPLPEGPPERMDLQRVWTQDDLLFCRWTRSGVLPPTSGT